MLRCLVCRCAGEQLLPQVGAAHRGLPAAVVRAEHVPGAAGRPGRRHPHSRQHPLLRYLAISVPQRVLFSFVAALQWCRRRPSSFACRSPWPPSPSPGSCTQAHSCLLWRCRLAFAHQLIIVPGFSYVFSYRPAHAVLLLGLAASIYYVVRPCNSIPLSSRRIAPLLCCAGLFVPDSARFSFSWQVGVRTAAPPTANTYRRG